MRIPAPTAARLRWYRTYGGTGCMAESPSIFLAFAAGFVSFVSPCVLPLVPGYLSTVCGLTPSELESARGAALRSVLVRAALFILTFSLIFVLLGMTATGVGNALFDNRTTLE